VDDVLFGLAFSAFTLFCGLFVVLLSGLLGNPQGQVFAQRGKSEQRARTLYSNDRYCQCMRMSADAHGRERGAPDKVASEPRGNSTGSGIFLLSRARMRPLARIPSIDFSPRVCRAASSPSPPCNKDSPMARSALPTVIYHHCSLTPPAPLRRGARFRGSRELRFSVQMPKMIPTPFQIPLLERLASKCLISRSSPTASSATCTRWR
jgi:hypothetical protein